MRVNRSLQTLNFLETTLNVPSISVISTPYVTRLSRKDLQKIIQVPVSLLIENFELKVFNF